MNSEIIIETKIIQWEGFFIIQGINYDICAQGKTKEDAISSFQKVVAGQIFLDIENGREPLETIKPANTHDIKRFDTGEIKKFFVDLGKFYATPIIKFS